MNVISPKYTSLFPRRKTGCSVHVTTNHPWVSWWGDQSSHQESPRSWSTLSREHFPRSSSPCFPLLLSLSPFSALLPWIQSPGPAEPLTSQPRGQPLAMGLIPETWSIIPLLLLMSTAGLGAWAGVRRMHGVCLFSRQAAQRVLENMSESGRISAAIGWAKMVAQMLFGGQQCHFGASTHSYMCKQHLLYVQWVPGKMTSQSTYRLWSTLPYKCRNVSLSWCKKWWNPSLSASGHGLPRRQLCGTAVGKAAVGRWLGRRQSRWVDGWAGGVFACRQMGLQPGSVMVAGAFRALTTGRTQGAVKERGWS